MLLRRLRWGLAGALVAWALMRAFGLERGWPLVPLFAFTPYVALLAVVVAAVAAWRRWWTGAIVTGACAALLLALLAPRAISDRAPAGAPGVRVRVLAANVAGNPAAAGRLIAALRRWDVDVFSAVELPPQVALAYEAAGVDARFPHRALQPRPGFSGTGLYSRLPLRPAASPGGTRFAFAAAELRAPGAAPVELLSVHVPAPTNPDATGQWRHDMRTLPSAGSGAPRLLAGDFNATLDHAELRRVLRRGYHDAAERAGVALRPTWPMGRFPLPTLITIDHVLADRRVRVLSARTVAIPGSDHRGVLADLLLPDADRGDG
ncbi:MAG: endonuclease/exonuclease/phosphatase family protein [Solirubrobacteraceae bacterium]